MQCKQSYTIQIYHERRAIEHTVRYYCSCVKVLLGIVLQEYENSKRMTKLEFQNYIENLVHTTSTHKAVYTYFDKQFYKFPSYLRRAAISEAIGCVKSYKKLLENWEAGGCKGKKPSFNRNQATMPCFFKKNMFELLGGNKCKIKLYMNNDWKWVTFVMRKSDILYIQNHFTLQDGTSPVLVKKNRKYCLCFMFQTDVKLPEKVHKVCAVDLGINHDAVCSILQEDGTVLARKFINNAREKDHLYRITNQIRKVHSKGNKKTPKLWSYADNYNKEISIQTVRKIIQFAIENDADCIVCEYLDMKGKKYGSKKQRLHLWRKRDIQYRLEQAAHRHGMRYARICARYTSQLAYDGSGKVKRDKKNYSNCIFTTGKQYNCDLNASYNIGARYFIKNLLNPLSESQRLAIEAKVPECAKRTSSTLSTLLALQKVI